MPVSHPDTEELVARHAAIPVLPTRDYREPVRILITSLSLGGAEKIVLDWGKTEAKRGRIVEIAALHSVGEEHFLPTSIKILRRKGKIKGYLQALCKRWSKYTTPISTHLVKDDVLRFLWERGIRTVPVIHNDRAGWRNLPQNLNHPNVPLVLACADAVAEQIRQAGYSGALEVIKHTPIVPKEAFQTDLREEYRNKLRVATDELLIGMLGAFKEQKNYPRAIRILAEAQKIRNCKLLVLGGTIDVDSIEQTKQLVKQLQLEDRCTFVGFSQNPYSYFPSIDVALNCSDFEGLSIATQEMLVAGIPVVATNVGGQQEIEHTGLCLLDKTSTDGDFAKLLTAHPIRENLQAEPSKHLSSLWSLSMSQSQAATQRYCPTLFVTANLNAGGAQRSLVNLAIGLQQQGKIFEIAVCNFPTNSYFSQVLQKNHIKCYQVCKTKDVIAITDSLLYHIHRKRVERVCFWNVDPKIKLLLAKFLAKDVSLLEVSPGNYAFAEMQATTDFQQQIHYTDSQFYQRLDHLVYKYKPEQAIATQAKIHVIRNGVPMVHVNKEKMSGCSILVSGRITPDKHCLEIVNAFQEFYCECKDAELFFYGQAEKRHQEYLDKLLATSDSYPIHFLGANPELHHLQKDFTMTIVLGKNQGCPNSVLEAFAYKIPVIANDSGGTRELVQNGSTGILLVENYSQAELVQAMSKMQQQEQERTIWVERAKKLVEKKFSMDSMVRNYSELLFLNDTFFSKVKTFLRRIFS
ncbi:MAG: glycosyltransferase [Spirochaetota bacterium]